MGKVAAPPARCTAMRAVDDCAFAVVWEQHADELRRRCRHWMGTADLGDEAFCRGAMLAFQKYEAHAAAILDPRAWLVAVVHNACMNLHRERRRERFELLDAAGPERLTARGNPEKDMIRGELARLLRRAVAELPARLRVPFELVVFEERSHRDVAQLLDLTEPSLRKRMQQARTRVRARLRAYDKGRPARTTREIRPPAHVSRPAVRYLVVQPITRHDGTRVDVERFTDELPPAGGEPELRRLQRYVERHPAGWKMRVRLARALLTAGATDAAIAQYRMALRRRPDRGALALELAAILRAVGDAAGAERLAAEVRAKQGPNAALLEANDAVRAGRISDAMARLEPLVGAGDPVALTLQDDALRASGMTPAASICGKPPGAARVFVDAAAVVENATLALVARGDTKRAMEEVRSMALREPVYVGAWLVFARVSAAAGREHDAIAAATRAYVLDRASTATAVEAARVIASFDGARAAGMLAAAPRHWPALLLACEIEAGRALDVVRAESLATAVITLEPSLAASWIRAAQVLLTAGLLETALATFARGLSLLPGDGGGALAVTAAEGIATAYERLGVPAAAVRWRRNARGVSSCRAGSATI